MKGETLIPDGWEVMPLGDVADVAFSSVDKRTVDGESPVELCNYTDVFYNRRIRPGMDFMTATASTSECQRWALRKGDVLFTKDSETPEEIGIPSYVTEDMPNVLCGYHLGMARPRVDVVDGVYLSETIRSPVSRRQFARIANGVTRFGLTLDATRSLPLLLPPMPEQRAIAAVLDSIDEAIERTEAVIAATERLRDALLHELLTRGVPGWHSKWKEVPGIGTIPACWEVVRLGDVGELVTSGSRAWSRYFRPDGALFVRSQNISGGTIDTSDAVFVQPPTDAEAARTRIQRGDLLVSITGEPGKVTVAGDTLGQAYVSQHVALVRLNNQDLSDCAGEFLRGRAGQKQFRGMAYGQTRPGLSLINVNDAKVAIPPPTERAIIGNVGKSFQRAIKETRSERERLRLLKVSAADALLTGQTRTRP